MNYIIQSKTIRKQSSCVFSAIQGLLLLWHSNFIVGLRKPLAIFIRHIAKVCKTRRKSDHKQPRHSHQQDNLLQNVPRYPDVNEKPEETLSTPEEDLPPQRKPLTVRLTLDGVPVSTQVDTGATVSIISHSTYNSL